jgi:5'-deoxynucleotidase
VFPLQNRFYALISRMRYIGRWGLMRNTFSENIQEHSHQVAVLAHALALMDREYCGNDQAPDPNVCAAAALFHDASEILTGDLATPIKYHDPAIRDAYKQVEQLSCQRLLDLLPDELRPHYEPLLLESDPAVAAMVKAADKLSAHIKCLEELRAGNNEYTSAARQTRQALEAMELPALQYFMDHFLDSFNLNLDEING